MTKHPSPRNRNGSHPKSNPRIPAALCCLLCLPGVRSVVDYEWAEPVQPEPLNLRQIILRLPSHPPEPSPKETAAELARIQALSPAGLREWLQGLQRRADAARVKPLLWGDVL